MKLNVIKHFASQLMKQPHSAAFIILFTVVPIPLWFGPLVEPNKTFPEQIFAGIVALVALCLILLALYTVIRFFMWVYEDAMCAWHRAKMIANGQGDEVKRMEADETHYYYGGP